MINDYTTSILIKNATSLSEKREIFSLTEAEQNQINNNLINKLFDSSLKRAHVDYGDIPKSKGDITKYSGYATMVETISVLKSLVEQNKVKVNIPELDIVDRAIGNIVANRNIFETGIKLNKDFVIMLYNTLVSSCVIATSALISSYIDFVKRIDNVEFTIINKNTDVGDIHIQILKSFNNSVASGEFTKSTNYIIKNDNKKITEESVTATAAIGGGVGAVAAKVGTILLIPVAIAVGLVILVRIIRLGVFYHQETKMKLANYLEMQAAFLELNKNNIMSQGYNVPAAKKQEILKKQQKLIEKLRSMATRLTADLVVSEKRALDNIEKEDSGWKFQDIKSEIASTDASGYQLL